MTITSVIEDTQKYIENQQAFFDTLQSYPLEDPFVDGDVIEWEREISEEPYDDTTRYTDPKYVGVAKKVGDRYSITNNLQYTSPDNGQLFIENKWPDYTVLFWDTFVINLAGYRINYETDITNLTNPG